MCDEGFVLIDLYKKFDCIVRNNNLWDIRCLQDKKSMEEFKNPLEPLLHKLARCSMHVTPIFDTRSEWPQRWLIASIRWHDVCLIRHELASNKKKKF